MDPEVDIGRDSLADDDESEDVDIIELVEIENASEEFELLRA